MEIFQTFTFDASHHLPNVPEGHKCGGSHGHTFSVRIFVAGPVDAEKGWVIDFGDLKTAFKPIHEQLDHKCLNDIPDLANPTSENLAVWIWSKLKPTIPNLNKVLVQESPNTGALYSGDNE
jgi:6-pyruvoyltetrahydropterin/6-carboxytetrahydropterin synthase